jgi:hypothetical protein
MNISPATTDHTGSEYTYSHASKSMKSILQACYIGTAGLGYLLGSIEVFVDLVLAKCNTKRTGSNEHQPGNY